MSRRDKLAFIKVYFHRGSVIASASKCIEITTVTADAKIGTEPNLAPEALWKQTLNVPNRFQTVLLFQTYFRFCKPQNCRTSV